MSAQTMVTTAKETSDIGFAGTMTGKDGNKWAVIQIFDQQFAQIMNETYNKEEFIARVKHDLAVEWLKETTAPAGYLTSGEFDPWKAVYPEQTARASTPVYVVE